MLSVAITLVLSPTNVTVMQLHDEELNSFQFEWENPPQNRNRYDHLIINCTTCEPIVNRKVSRYDPYTLSFKLYVYTNINQFSIYALYILLAKVA